MDALAVKDIVTQQCLPRRNNSSAQGKCYARHRFVLELTLAGKSTQDIAEITGYSKGTIQQILNRDDVRALHQQIMSAYDIEFKSLYPKVISTLKDCLEHPDPEIGLKASSTWLRAFKDSEKKNVMTTNVTAEDVVFNILNGDVQQNAA